MEPNDEPKMPDRKPDAIKLPKSWIPAGNSHVAADLVCTFAEEHLGGDRKKGLAGGGVAFIKSCDGDAPDDTYFCTLNYKNKPIHEPGHERQGQPRYDWFKHPIQLDGVTYTIDYGFLHDDATPAGKTLFAMRAEARKTAKTNPVMNHMRQLKKS